MSYEAWRISFQNSDQAARAAYEQALALAVQNAELVAKIVKLESLRDKEEARLDLITDVVNSVLHNNAKTAPIEAITSIGDILDSDRSECLRQIQAETIERALDSIGVPCTKFKNQSDDFTGGFNFCGAQMQIHANRIKEGTL